MNVRDLITETVSLLEALLAPGLQLVIRDGPDLATVRGAYAHLQQVILNICRNAAQAMDDVGRIEIETDVIEIKTARSLNHEKLTPGHYVRIAVIDNGRGMSKATLSRVFEPFFTTRLAGSGLGLATAREIIREHQGAMHIQSEPGVGTRFETWLPSCSSPPPASSETLGTLPFGSGETVLVIDEDIERLLRDEEILAALGYEPVGFTHVADAFAACRATPERFDAIVVGHPEPAGPTWDLIATLQAVAPRQPIIVAMASSSDMDADALINIGISEIVGLPLTSSTIASALARCLKVPAPAARA